MFKFAGFNFSSCRLLFFFWKMTTQWNCNPYRAFNLISISFSDRLMLNEVEILFSHLCSWPRGPNQDFSQLPSSTVSFSSPVPFRQFQTCAHVWDNLNCLFLQSTASELLKRQRSIWRLHLYTVMSPIFWPSFHTPAVTPAATAAPRAVTWRGKHGHLGKHSFSAFKLMCLSEKVVKVWVTTVSYQW